MRRITRKMSATLAAILIIVSMCGAQVASAKTLAQSFSGGTSLYVSEPYYWRKKAWAKTEGYNGYHYVRAYIGGNSSSATGAIADTARKYSRGDIKCTATAPKKYCRGDSIAAATLFPTGYAKYGSS